MLEINTDLKYTDFLNELKGLREFTESSIL